MKVAILIPARNEADALPTIVSAVVDAGYDAESVIVVDNGSNDGSGDVARRLGTTVIEEPRPGYGQACLAGIDWLRAHRTPDVLVFLDADDFSAAAQLGPLLEPIERDEADLVIGERRSHGVGGVRWHAKLGNRLVLAALRRLYGSVVRDMGPFRAIRWITLESLRLDDTNYGWYVQMQVRALRGEHRVRGLAVEFERRTVGKSKVSGSPTASLRAGWGMLSTLAIEVVRRSGTSPELK